ncbi:MAG: Gfo/Idh/MocA family oxidoreductase [Solobacterium sp.]|nr:Gfo/Idh/MocA family oxidoreductase [Solobacterium sp.]
MCDFRPVITGVIGAGAISDAYLSNLTGRFSDRIKVKYISASHIERAEKKAAQYGVIGCTNDVILNDPEVEMVIILTPVAVHGSLIRSALEAGKHVYTEKTITVNSSEAEELILLAKEKGLYLGSAPDTFLGSSFATAKKAIDDGMLGEIHSFTASITRNNDILTGMFPFLRQPGAGILRDYVVYYLTALTTLLGRTDTVAAFLQTPYPERTCNFPGSPDCGKTITTPNEAILTAVLKLENGITGTFHDDSETCLIDRADFVIYGTRGMLLLGNPNNFGDPVRFVPAIPASFTEPQTPVILDPVNDYSSNCRGLGACDMAEAIRNSSKHRANAELALHVLRIIEALEKSAAEGTFVPVR